MYVFCRLFYNSILQFWMSPCAVIIKQILPASFNAIYVVTMFQDIGMIMICMAMKNNKH